MHIVKALPDAICLSHEKSYWLELIDYEHVSFRYHKCHDHGHLFRDCPPNRTSLENLKNDEQDADGFRKMGKKETT